MVPSPLDSGTNPPLVDTHAHLELEPLVRDPGGVVKRALRKGVRAIITVGIDLDDARAALDIAETFEMVHAAVGFHPHNAVLADDDALSRMESLLSHPKVKAYGEVGLDFYRDRSPRERQREAFGDQLVLAKRGGKPVIIHLRDAYREGLDLLERTAPFPEGGVVHCFSGGRDDLDRILSLGFHISIPGTITYKNNDSLRDLVRRIPQDRLLLETDCPFLSPEPLRGKTNEPAHIIHTAKRTAQVRGVSLDDLARTTTENASRLFGLEI